MVTYHMTQVFNNVNANAGVGSALISPSAAAAITARVAEQVASAIIQNRSYAIDRVIGYALRYRVADYAPGATYIYNFPPPGIQYKVRLIEAIRRAFKQG
ncbi:MAG: hypothetical protein EXR81_06570 [Gammaproteobacteria bacterium]|nr:hypothetical protein [Gammaproteobacteria bacterium]